jgi:hypothetical protein
MKDCKIKILIAVLITAAATFLLTKEFSPEYEVVNKKSDTTTTVKVKVKVQESSFSAEQVGNIKRVLIDSLSAVYGKRIKLSSSFDRLRMTGQDNNEDSTVKKEYAYVSEVDTVFVAVDENNEVTDSLHVTSTFISPEPLPESSLHLLNLKHKSFNKTVETETTITTTETVEQKKTFWNRFIIVPNVSAGIGLINRQFDIYAGVGIGFEL